MASSAPLELALSERALNDRISVYRLRPRQPLADLILLTAQLISSLCVRLNESTGVVKLQFRPKINFVKSTDELTNIDAYFSTTAIPIYRNTCLEDVIASGMDRIRNAVDKFVQMGSGWVVNAICFLDVYRFKYHPFAAASYIPLPRHLSQKKAILNIMSTDHRCFAYCVLAALHPSHYHEHANRPSKYDRFMDELDFTGITFPINLDAIDRFEARNGRAINVFGYDTRLYPLRISECAGDVINLLFIKNEKGNTHYTLIKDFNRLLYSQTRHKARKHFCVRCLCGFVTEEKLINHQLFCESQNQAIEMPEDGSKMTFQNHRYAERAPLIIYADFECFLRKMDSPDSSAGSKSTKVQHHIANSFAALPVYSCCGQQSTGDLELYRGENAVERFLTYVIDQGLRFQCEYDHKNPMILSHQDRCEFEAATTCHICGHALFQDDRVRDHCHLCGRFRGAAHYSCNIRYWLTRDVKVVFHNLRRYDGHLIMQEIGAIAIKRGLEISCIPKSVEEYIAFNLMGKHTHTKALGTDGNPKIVSWKLAFIDSLQFLSASLSDLADTLLKSGRDKFYQMSRHFTQEQLDLVLRKGLYPYQKITDWSDFNYTELYPLDDFYSDLTMTGATLEEWLHAKHVWDYFNFRRFGQYHDLYLTVDVILLADIFENFRLFCREQYKLDPCHYVSLPSFAWDAMLRMTGVRLDLLSDPDMYCMLESGIRGEISQISNRYAKANNQYMSDYNKIVESSYLVYLDANNLYGGAMMSPLPEKDFEWARPDFDYMSLPDEGPVGCILEVDLQYPKELHCAHNDYPLAPENVIIDNPSPYSLELAEQINLKPVPTRKLVPNFNDKARYVIHFRNLKFYRKHGLKVKKVHRVLRFMQRAWMKTYIDFNTEQRKKSNSDFYKNLFKLLNNAVFGKSMENIRNRIVLKLITEEKKYNKLVASPLFKEAHIFTEELVAISMNKESVLLNKPIYAGFSVLELSKLVMYGFHYEYMIPKYGPRSMLMFTDTDSLLYHIRTEDFYEDILPDIDQYFDTSDYKTNHKCFSTKNKKVPGMMHDETSGRIIQEFVGLRSKMYSILCGEGEEKKRAKGVKKVVVEKSVHHEDYRNVRDKGCLMQHEMRMFKSEKHQIFAVDVKKISLSAYDDKRYLLDGGIFTLAYGHHQIKN